MDAQWFITVHKICISSYSMPLSRLGHSYTVSFKSRGISLEETTLPAVAILDLKTIGCQRLFSLYLSQHGDHFSIAVEVTFRFSLPSPL